jgi:integrase
MRADDSRVRPGGEVLAANIRRVRTAQRFGFAELSRNLTDIGRPLMLTLLGKVLEDEVKQGTLSRNVAKLVEHPHQVKKDMKTWTAEQAATFLETAADHRLSAAFQLSLYGLRRGEVLGLCWSDVDLQAKTITIRRA